MNAHQISNIILNVTLIATFIGVFFFTYAKTIEENVVKTQSELIATYLAKDLSLFINKDNAQLIASSLKPPDMSQQDKAVEKNNIKLKNEAFHTLSIVFVIGLLLTIIISKYYKLNFTDILKTNFYILVFIAITYYIFLTYIGQHFISLDPNFVRRKILISLKKALENHPFNIPLTLEQASQLLSPDKINKLYKTYPTLQKPPEQLQQNQIKTPEQIPY